MSLYILRFLLLAWLPGVTAGVAVYSCVYFSKSTWESRSRVPGSVCSDSWCRWYPIPWSTYVPETSWQGVWSGLIMLLLTEREWVFSFLNTWGYQSIRYCTWSADRQIGWLSVAHLCTRWGTIDWWRVVP